MRQRLLRSTLAAGIVAALALTAAGTASADLPAPAASTVNIVDKDATAATKSLFSYLSTTRGQQVLFGAQHTNNVGITFNSTDPKETRSDVLAATGDYPAIFGFDTLVLEGKDKPGVAGRSMMENVVPFVETIQTAHSLGGIPQISAHMKDFASGVNTSAGGADRTVAHILPGGELNSEFNEYLDAVAQVANTATDETGALIPIIFRPFHENTGGWFWWGAGHATTGEFKELFRYTVEYLRDTRGVHNFLYAFSPNASFEGDEARYLDTYPGDEWIDILGYDSYENNNAPENSDAYVASVVKDLAMISRTADAHGKIPALTEFGRNGERSIFESGNKSLDFFTDLLAGIKADPDAKRIAFMLTWVNYNNGYVSIPNAAYTDDEGVAHPAHEMLGNFREFYADDYSGFARDIPADALKKTGLTATPATPTLRIVSPADGVRVTTPQTTVRVKATVDSPTSVWFTVSGDPTEHDLALGADGYHTAVWDVGEEGLTNATVKVTVHATYATQDAKETRSAVVLGSVPELPVGVMDDFEGYGDDAALQSAYAFSNAPSSILVLADGASGSRGVEYAYDFSARDYQGFGKVLGSGQDWSVFDRLNLWLDSDGSNQKLVLQLKVGDMTFEAYPSLATQGAQNVSIPFAEFRPPSWDSANKDQRLTPERLKSVSQIYVFLNKTDSYTQPGSIGLDNVRAAKAELPEPSPTSSATATTAPTTTPSATAAPTTTVTSTTTVTATPPSSGDLYTTPGYHSVNGRKWFTSCEPYSVTWRCTTEIWSTQVTLKAGKFEKSTGWFFNNLTYLPSKRASWAGNPLARTGSWTSTQGRQWRTECDTAVTGGNGCRSYIRSNVVQATKRPGGYSYAMTQTWVFNNIVLFS